MNGMNPADLRATPGRVAVTGDGERVRYHEEMGHQFEHDGEWVMMCGTFMDSLDWPARWEESK